ncbi:MAG: flagellar biosynthesis protein FlhA [Planctomycetes bacterium]|nr:flagellar biosynthesis protein FlhA [Planctomycetota bacterium]
MAANAASAAPPISLAAAGASAAPRVAAAGHAAAAWTPPPPAAPVFRNADVGLAIGLVGLLMILLVPLPPWLLDLLLVVNLASSILMLLLVLASGKPLELSTFPTLLLFSALFRLALNVASTRLILLHGHAGDVIQSFGEFVVGGNLVVGVVIFLILVVIQFVVITKGAGRISEVAARFTLDAMPGKQMAIDAELNNGSISPEEAKARRSEVSREAEFHGAMDGASKFVRGDAVAGLIITGVNLVGGICVALMRGMDVSQAFKTYSILSIGDGLVAQIPALIVATAGAIIVTKASIESNLGDQLALQVTEQKRGVLMAGVIVGLIGMAPGLPLLPFAVLSAALIALSRMRRAQPEAVDEGGDAAASAVEEQSVELERLLKIDAMNVELGYRLLHLVEKNKSGGLLSHIAQVRKRFAGEMGVIVPPIRVTDNVKLAAGAYRILVRGQVVAAGELRPGMLLAMNPGKGKPGFPGEATREPTFGLPALWIEEARRTEAELAGYTVVEPVSVLVTHLSESIREQSSLMLTRDDVKTLVENVRKDAPAVVDDLIPNQLSYGDLHRVLRALLAERVSIKNLAAILEVVSEHVGQTKDPDALAELARRRLARTVVEPYLDDSGKLSVVTFDPALERTLVDVARNQESGDGANVVRVALDRILVEVKKLAERGQETVVLVRAEARTFLRDLLKSVAPRAVVLSYAEAAAAKRVEPVAIVSLAEAPGRAVA